MKVKACDRCGREMDAFTGAPCCLHGPPCAIWFCWRCGRVWYRGVCSREALRENPVETCFAREPSAPALLAAPESTPDSESGS